MCVCVCVCVCVYIIAIVMRRRIYDILVKKITSRSLFKSHYVILYAFVPFH